MPVEQDTELCLFVASALMLGLERQVSGYEVKGVSVVVKDYGGTEVDKSDGDWKLVKTVGLADFDPITDANHHFAALKGLQKSEVVSLYEVLECLVRTVDPCAVTEQHSTPDERRKFWKTWKLLLQEKNDDPT